MRQTETIQTNKCLINHTGNKVRVCKKTRFVNESVIVSVNTNILFLPA